MCLQCYHSKHRSVATVPLMPTAVQGIPSLCAYACQKGHFIKALRDPASNIFKLVPPDPKELDTVRIPIPVVLPHIKTFVRKIPRTFA